MRYRIHLACAVSSSSAVPHRDDTISSCIAIILSTPQRNCISQRITTRPRLWCDVGFRNRSALRSYHEYTQFRLDNIAAQSVNKQAGLRSPGSICMFSTSTVAIAGIHSSSALKRVIQGIHTHPHSRSVGRSQPASTHTHSMRSRVTARRRYVKVKMREEAQNKYHTQEKDAC